jgi:ankyrin repeat protein
MTVTISKFWAALLVAMVVSMSDATKAEAPSSGAALRAATAAGDIARVRALLESGVPLDEPDESGRTALLIAVDRGDNAAARALIDAGANINAQAANKDTPWLLAGARGQADILRHMLPKGPDLTIRNRFGGNALIPACERGHVEAIDVLLTSKIDVDHINNLGWTCLLEIVILGDGGPRHIEAAKRVLAAGANPNIADRDGVTALAHAQRRGQTEVARLIAEAGGRASL